MSFWRLNEQSGTTAKDSKDGNNGGYEGAVTLGVAGLVSSDSQDTDNFGAQFDGQTGYVEVPFAANLNQPKFTVEALVQPSTDQRERACDRSVGHRLSTRSPR